MGEPAYDLVDVPGAESQMVLVEHEKAEGPDGEGKLTALVPVDALDHYAEKGWTPVKPAESSEPATGSQIPDGAATGRTGLPPTPPQPPVNPSVS